MREPDRDEDPEVIADLIARAASERDKTRKRTAEWIAPAIVDHWPCRTCRVPVGVTRDAIDAADVFDRGLVARGEQHIDRDRVMFCPACVEKHRVRAVARREHEQEQIADLVRRLKRSPAPEHEHELHVALKAVGHPDIPGLIQACADRLTSKGKRRGPSGQGGA